MGVHGHSNAICELPDDLLCIVFAIVADIEPLMFYSTLGRNNVLGFLRLSEVCRRFRAVLLSMPTLWGDIVSILPREQDRKLALARSRSSPLTASFAFPCDADTAFEYQDLAAMAVEHAARLRSLTVLNITPDLHSLLFASALPLLENITLEYGKKGWVSVAVRDCIDAPNLVRAYFKLTHEENVWGFGINIRFKLPALRSLIVLMEKDVMQKPRNLDWIVDVLELSQHIEVFHLGPNFAYVGPDSVYAPERLQKTFGGGSTLRRHLRSLNLIGDCDIDLPGFFRRICATPPPRCMVDSGNVVQTSEFANLFGPMLRNPSHDGLYVEYLDFHSCHRVRVGTFPALDDLAYENEFPRNLPEVFHIGFFSYASAGPLQNLSDAIVAPLKHNTITQLVVGSHNPSAWPAMLEFLTSVCETVTVLWSHETWSWVEKRPGFPLCAPPESFPVLDTLLIAHGHNRYDMDAVHEWWVALVAWLRRRAQAGLRLRRLHIIEVHNELFDKVTNAGPYDDSVMRAQAAGLVDELTGESVDEY